MGDTVVGPVLRYVQGRPHCPVFFRHPSVHILLSLSRARPPPAVENSHFFFVVSTCGAAKSTVAKGGDGAGKSAALIVLVNPLPSHTPTLNGGGG